MLKLRVLGLSLAIIFIHVWVNAALTNNLDYSALKALTYGWKNLPQSWVGGDPCGRDWDGISCENSRIATITLASMGLTGQLTGDLASLSELQILDLSYNEGPTGSIPSSIGELSKLTTLSLNKNKFTGEVPASIGKLKNLYWLDLSDNLLTGNIPVSDGSKPGLDMLVNTKHFHFGKNNLSGEIPPKLFSSDMKLIHVLFDNNKLTGSIPETLGLVKDLQSIRFDRNFLSGALPPNLNNLTDAMELHAQSFFCLSTKQSMQFL